MYRLQKLQSAYADWWIRDFSPLHGSLRFCFYIALFYFAIVNFKSPLAGVGFYEATDPNLIRSYGLLSFLKVPPIDPIYVRVIVFFTAAAWLFAAIGFLTRISTVATAAGALFLHGLFFGSNSLNHNWFLAVYALIALCFMRTNDAWSVDYYLWGKRTDKLGRQSLLDTGFARKLILVFAVGFYFAAGVTKLTTTGISWSDGHVIQYFAETRGDQYFLAPFLADNPWICRILAIGSMVVEVGAPLALISRRARYALLVGWIMLHLGIRYSLGPAYWQNILVLLLLVEWGAIWNAMRDGAAKLIGKSRSADQDNRDQGFGTATGWVATAAGSALLALALTPALLQQAWWPLTNVYMYSPYFSQQKDIRAGHPITDYDQAGAAQSIAKRFLTTRPNKEETEYMCYRTGLRLTREGAEPRYLFASLGVVDWKQWVLTIAGPVVIADLAAKPQGKIEYDPEHPNYPAQDFLSSYASVLKHHLSPEIWLQYDRLEMVYVVFDKVQERDRSPGTDQLPDEFWEHCTVEARSDLTATAICIASVPLFETRSADLKGANLHESRRNADVRRAPNWTR